MGCLLGGGNKLLKVSPKPVSAPLFGSTFCFRRNLFPQGTEAEGTPSHQSHQSTEDSSESDGSSGGGLDVTKNRPFPSPWVPLMILFFDLRNLPGISLLISTVISTMEMVPIKREVFLLRMLCKFSKFAIRKFAESTNFLYFPQRQRQRNFPTLLLPYSLTLFIKGNSGNSEHFFVILLLCNIY